MLSLLPNEGNSEGSNADDDNESPIRLLSPLNNGFLPEETTADDEDIDEVDC